MELVVAIGCCHGESFWKLVEISTSIVKGEEREDSKALGDTPYASVIAATVG